jgi:hypothetical protein
MDEVIKKQILKKMNHSIDKIIPIECFLNRVFPVSNYEKTSKEIVESRVFQPRRDCEPYKIIIPIDWEAEWAREDRNWRMQLQGMVMFHPIMNFFDEYQEKVNIVSYFFEVIQDWLLKYGEDANDIVTNRMPASYAWYDMSVGFRSLVIAFFIDRISHFQIEITDAELTLLSEITSKHVSHLFYEPAFSLNNHGMFQIQGLMALIQLLGVDNYLDEYSYALDKMEALVFSQYNSKGIHLEHSPHYHFYALSTFDNALKTGWYNFRDTIPNVLLMAHGKKKWIVDPLNRPACIGDSILTEQKGISYDKIQGDNYSEYVKNGQSYVLSDFDESGYSVIRSNWDTAVSKSTYLFFMGMYQSKVHKHRDCLSFEWFDKGDKILCDSGKYGYKSDKYRHYFLSNKAHNTVEIEGFDILKIKPYISAVVGSKYQDEVFVVEGNLDYPAIKYNRKIYLNPGKWLIVSDHLDFKRARKATQWFHLVPGYSIVSSENNLLKFKHKNNKELIVHCITPDVKCSLFQGDEERMQGFVSQKDYEFESAPAIGFDYFGDKEHMLTILALDNSSYQSALDFIDYKKMGVIPAVNSVLRSPQTNSLIKNIRHVFFENNQDLKVADGKGTYGILSKDSLFEFFVDNKKSKKVVIMLPGATDRSKTIKNFQRHSWSDDFNCSVVSFIDPTINEYNDLSIGWYQGSVGNYLIPKLAIAISTLIKSLGVCESDVLFFGSSAGGFASLKLADYFPKTTVVVINPQIYLNHYTHTHYQKLISYSYKGSSVEDVEKTHKDRISVDIDIGNRVAPIFYFQNTCDKMHVNKHLKPFVNKFNEGDCNYLVVDLTELDQLERGEYKFNVLYYSDPESGHSPPNKDSTIEMINSVFKI